MRYHLVGMRVAQTSEPVADRNHYSVNEEFRYLRMLVVLLGDRKRIAIITFISLLLGVVIAFSLTVNFTAVATILPPPSPSVFCISLDGATWFVGQPEFRRSWKFA